jgi:hypothetical protein
MPQQPAGIRIVARLDTNPQIQIANQLRVSQPIITADYTGTK